MYTTQQNLDILPHVVTHVVSHVGAEYGNVIQHGIPSCSLSREIVASDSIQAPDFEPNELGMGPPAAIGVLEFDFFRALTSIGQTCSTGIRMVRPSPATACGIGILIGGRLKAGVILLFGLELEHLVTVTHLLRALRLDGALPSVWVHILGHLHVGVHRLWSHPQAGTIQPPSLPHARHDFLFISDACT